MVLLCSQRLYIKIRPNLLSKLCVCGGGEGGRGFAQVGGGGGRGLDQGGGGVLKSIGKNY